ncbi:MAG: nucleotide-diphospho-sugar transferase [Bacteroidales bacterium]|nr:nucleotide-diphospho-sugar transferase [Bacteroidales bacterium]
MRTKSPVLFIIFNRLDTTIKVLDAIRQYQPDRLYIASDGARDSVPKEKKTVELVREYVLKNIDWDCDVKTLFRDKNVGCGHGPSGAITWFFEHEEMGIILEDDCVPSMPFFLYCEHLLKKYQYDNRVWVISGRSNYPTKKFFKEQDYLFSNYVVTWGWATWKRCWQHFDINLNKSWPDFYRIGGFKNVFFTRKEGIFRNLIYSRLQKDKDLMSHVWDFQFFLCVALNRGLSVIPSENLVENIGYEGTHFMVKTKILTLKASSNYQIKKEPRVVLPNREYERYHFYRDVKRRLTAFILSRLLKVLNKLKR